MSQGRGLREGETTDEERMMTLKRIASIFAVIGVSTFGVSAAAEDPVLMSFKSLTPEAALEIFGRRCR